MKKSVVICSLITLLSVLGLAYMGSWVAMQDEKVTLKETVLSGDKEQASDIAFQISTHWDEKMLWETKAQIGERTQTDTDFSFYPNGMKLEYADESSARFEYSMNFGYGSSANLLDEKNGGNPEIPYYKVFVDVASRTEPGEERKEQVRLSDYYKYYEMNLFYRSDYYLGKYVSDELAFRDYINEVVAMKLPEDLMFEAKVKKHENGHVYDIGGNAVDNTVQICSEGIVLKDGAYVYVYAIDENGLVPGLSENGYGIYKLPVTWNEQSVATILVEEFRLVYPLEEKMHIIRSDEEEKELFLVVERAGQIYLQRIDKESMTLLQEFALGITQEWTACQDMQITEQGILLIMNDKRVYYAEKQGNSYEVTVRYDLSQVEELANGSWDTYKSVYEDGRLAFVWGDAEGHYYESSNSVYVFVLEGEEMTFLAHYENSLDSVDFNWKYGNKLHPIQPYKIWFEEN